IDPSTGDVITADTDSTGFRVYDTQYDLLDGFENTVKHSEHVSVIGTGNEVLNSNGNIIIGDLHGISGGGNNIIIGSSATPSDEAAVLEGFQAVQHTADIENTVMLGYNTDVRVSKGVALGSDSIAKTGAGVVGYDPVTGKASKLTSSTWVATAAAISVGNEKKTWYGFSESGLQSAIEDNKSALEALGVDTSLAPADLLASLNDEQLNLLKSHLDYDERISETRPEQAETLYVASPGSGTTRQITNVAAGFNDTDAVNVAQLKSVSTHYYSVNTTKETDEEENSNYSNDGAIGNNALAAGVHTSAVGVASTAVGNYADAQGIMSTVVGSNSKAIDTMASILVEVKQASAAAVGTGSSDKQTLMNMINPVIQKMPSVVSAGSTVIGSFNTIDNNEDSVTKAQALVTALKNNGGTQIATKAVQYLDSVKAFDGVSNTLVGSLNTTKDSNVAVIYGTGNSIVNSYENFEPALDTIKNVDIDSIIAGLQGNKIQKALALMRLQSVFNGLSNMGTATQLQEYIENSDFEGIKDILSNYIKENGGKGGRSIAIGTNNKIENANQAITFGTNNTVTGDKSIAIGTGHTISGANSGAFGDPSTISGNNSYAIGNNNTIAVADAFVLGNDAQATADNVVALGNKSIAGAAATVNGYDPVTGTAHVLESDEVNNLQIESAWKATAGTVSVGGGTTKRKNEQGQYLNAAGRVVTRESQAADITMTRQITNVAAGSALTDAVNVAQMMAAQVEIVGGDNVEVIKENSNGHIKYTIHSLNAMVEAGENITVTADTPEKTEETNGKTTDLTTEGDGTTGGSGGAGETGETTAEPTDSDEPITPSGTNNHTTTYTIDAKDTRNTVKAGENITVKEKNNDDGSITYTISAQAATNVKVIDGENTTVTEGTEGDFTTYAVNVKTDGKVAPGDTGIVTGDTVYNETRVKKDGNYIKKDNTAAENITALDEKVKDNSTRIDNINNQFGDLDNRMRKGLAGAAALAALHPMDFNPDDKMQFSAGVGHYRGETAAAIGAFYRPDESVMFSIGGTFGNSDNMINAGITFGLDGTRNRITRSRTAMAREIQDLRSLVTQMAARMDRLEGGTNLETAMFPDVPENHWAYEYVEDLQKRGALKGYPDGLFKGDRAMTRYEFAAMLDRLVRSGVRLDSKIAKEFEPELGRIYVERISGQDNDRKKVERVRVNNSDSKYPEGKTRDVYGSKIVTAVAEKAVAK
ncbi:MAG: YadA-like family protein, partial [Acidaminococcaceae bacterium]|nr:YadA-like family protein [Acidaminococcaceae bacterium]